MAWGVAFSMSVRVFVRHDGVENRQHILLDRGIVVLVDCDDGCCVRHEDVVDDV